jgi:hypothetical protein
LASINFASTGNKVERGIVFEDESIIVMNKQDLHNICILAIEGYGEQNVNPQKNLKNEDITMMDAKSVNNNDNILPNDNMDVVGKSALFRGRRTWSDSVGGATVCCNQCCSILGYASLEEPDSCRLLKHRLCAKEEAIKIIQAGDDVIAEELKPPVLLAVDYFLSNTSATFIARELIRYAESQAVFTFVIFNSDMSEKILLLKLLSWNSYMSFSKNEDKDKKESTGSLTQFRRVAKVIYEEIDNLISHDLVNGHNDDTDPMNFTWGGIDLCCPPSKTNKEINEVKRNSNVEIFNGDTESKACVHIHLPGDEWAHLKEALRLGNKFIPDEISRVTVLLKLGNSGDAKDNATLSVLSLP